MLSWFSPLHLKEMKVFNNNPTTPDKSRIKNNHLHPQALWFRKGFQLHCGTVHLREFGLVASKSSLECEMLAEA